MLPFLLILPITLCRNPRSTVIGANQLSSNSCTTGSTASSSEARSFNNMEAVRGRGLLLFRSGVARDLQYSFVSAGAPARGRIPIQIHFFSCPHDCLRKLPMSM